MGSGLYASDPASMLNAFTAWDQNRFNMAQAAAKDREAYLDDQAARAQHASDQMGQFIEEERPKIADQLRRMHGDDVFNAMTEDELEDAVADEFMRRNGKAILGEATAGIQQNYFLGKGFEDLAGKNRLLEGFEPTEVLDENGQPTGKMAFRAVVRDKKTNKVGEAQMTSRELLNNLQVLGERAALSRGQATTRTRERTIDTMTDVHNRGLDEAAAGLGAAAKSAGEAGAKIAGEIGRTTVLGTNEVSSPAPGGAVSTSGGLAAGGAATPPVLPEVTTAAPDPATAGAAPVSGKTPAKTIAVRDPDRGVIRDVIRETASAAGKRDAEADIAAQRAWLNDDRTFFKPTDRVFITLQDGVDKLNAAYEAAGARGVIDPGTAANVKRLGRDLEKFGVGLRAAESRGLHPDLLGLLGGKPPPEVAAVVTPGTFAAGQKKGDELLQQPDVQAAMARVQGGEMAPEQFAEFVTKTYKVNLDPKTLQATIDAATKSRLAGERRTKLTGAQSKTLAIALSLGLVTEEQLKATLSPAKAVGEAQGKDIENLRNQTMQVSDPNVDTSIVRQRMADVSAAQRETNRAFVESLGKPADDKLLDMIAKAHNAFGVDPKTPEGMEFTSIFVDSLETAAAEGLDVQTQTGTAFVGRLTQMVQNANKSSPGLIARLGGAQQFKARTIAPAIANLRKQQAILRSNPQNRNIAIQALNQNATFRQMSPEQQAQAIAHYESGLVAKAMEVHYNSQIAAFGKTLDQMMNETPTQD